MIIVKGCNTASVLDRNGEVVEIFESSGCIYNDLGCCQGCPECSLHSSEELWNVDEGYYANVEEEEITSDIS